MDAALAVIAIDNLLKFLRRKYYLDENTILIRCQTIDMIPDPIISTYRRSDWRWRETLPFFSPLKFLILSLQHLLSQCPITYRFKMLFREYAMHMYRKEL